MMSTGEEAGVLSDRARQWRLISDGAHSGAVNMATDEALLLSHADGESPPILRLYRWEPPSLTIGYFQSYRREVDEEGCRARGFDWVRRPTGGRAVLHQHELTYAVIIGEHLLSGSVLQTYRALSEALVEGVRRLGLEAELAPGRPPTRRDREASSAACFDSATPHEVTVEGRKVIGSAQVRQRGVLLQHGSVPLWLDRDAAVDTLNLGSDAVRRRVRATLEKKAAGLDELTRAQLDYDRVADALQRGFASTFSLQLQRDELSIGERERVERLYSDKYSKDEWNRKR